jgi:hypothetical protein
VRLCKGRILLLKNEVVTTVKKEEYLKLQFQFPSYVGAHVETAELKVYFVARYNGAYIEITHTKTKRNGTAICKPRFCCSIL